MSAMPLLNIPRLGTTYDFPRRGRCGAAAKSVFSTVVRSPSPISGFCSSHNSRYLRKATTDALCGVAIGDMASLTGGRVQFDG